MNKQKIFITTLLLCIALATVTKAQTLTLVPSNYNGNNVSCFGAQDGSINLTITGGTPPYTIHWSNDATTEDISNLPAGFYLVEVDDADSTTDMVSADITLTEPEELRIQITASDYIVNTRHYNISLNGACNGSITPNVTGGTTPYTYNWEPYGQTTANLTNICAGGYNLNVTDANGCATPAQQDMTEPDRDDWQMTGNTGSSPYSHFIGTIDNQDLSFKTYNQERLRIKANGDIKISSLASNTIIYSSVVADSLGNLFVSKYKSACLPVWSSDLQRNTITAHCPNTNIKVGIGTRYPIFDFELFKESGLNESAKMKCQTASTMNAEIWTVNPAGSFGFATDAAGRGRIYENIITLNPIMTFINSGKVGIGMEPPNNGSDFKLYVLGGISAREIKVTAVAWPDYVFTKGYNLMSLYELEQYVNLNNHLPEIPSAKEIEKNNGYEVGDMVTKLVKTVEEQTLYIIQQQKQIDELKTAVRKLDRRK